MFWSTLTIENTKTLKRTLLWVELGLLAVLALGLNAILYSTVQSNPGGNAMPAEIRTQLQQLVTWPGALINALSLAGGNSLGGLLLIILVGAVTAQEYTWRMMHLWLGKGTPRPALLVAKFTALLLPALLIVLTSLVATGVITAFFSFQINGSLRLEQLDFSQFILSAVRTAFTLLPYAGLAFLLAIVSRSTVVAVGGGLAYALLIENVLAQALSLVSGSLGRIAHYLPVRLAGGLLSLNQASANMTVWLNAGPGLETLAPLPSAIGIVLWTLLFVGLAVWAFQRQDLVE